MIAESKRLARLRRLERLRALAKQTAATQAAQAESTLAQLRGVALRSQGLADGYAVRPIAQDGAALAEWLRFSAGVQAICTTTASDAARAQGVADGMLAELARAERSRAAVEDRAQRQERTMGKAATTPALTARRATGTPLE